MCRPNKKSWVFYIIISLSLLGALISSLTYFASENLIFSLIPLIFWLFIGPIFAERRILKAFSSKKLNIANNLIGLKVYKEFDYYLERKAIDFDFKKVSEVVMRLGELILISLGISLLLSKIITPIITTEADLHPVFSNMSDLIINNTIYITPSSMTVIAFLGPLLWIAEDVHISGIDENPRMIKLHDALRNGFLSKILGFSGLALLLAEEYVKLQNSGMVDSLFVFIFIFIWDVIYVLSAISATPFIIGLIYLLTVHENYVNQLRHKLASVIPIGISEVRLAVAEELPYLASDTQNLSEPKLMGKLKGFWNHPLGKTILILVIIASSFLILIFTLSNLLTFATIDIGWLINIYLF